MKQTYIQPTKIKVLAILALILFNVIICLIFIEIIDSRHILIEYIYYLLSCVSICIAINYTLFQQLKEKAIIDSHSITLHSLLKSKTIKLKDIKGYQLKNKNIYLIPYNEESKVISFSDNLVGEGKIIDYFKKED